jgi:hypothetical protein
VNRGLRAGIAGPIPANAWLASESPKEAAPARGAGWDRSGSVSARRLKRLIARLEEGGSWKGVLFTGCARKKHFHNPLKSLEYFGPGADYQRSDPHADPVDAIDLRSADFFRASYRPNLVTAGIGKAAYRGGA